MSADNSPDSSGITFTNNWFAITAKPVWDKIIPKINPRAILEIGSYEGASACYLIANCASRAPIEMHCIDTWEGGAEHAGTDMADVERRFLENIDIARAKVSHDVKLVVHKGYSNRCLARLLSEKFMDYFDLVYIDGSHQAPDVLSDAVISFPLLKVGGVMIFDDYLWTEGNLPQHRDPLSYPKPAIDAFINIYFRKMQVLFSANSQVCARKLAD